MKFYYYFGIIGSINVISTIMYYYYKKQQIKDHDLILNEIIKVKEIRNKLKEILEELNNLKEELEKSRQFT